MAKSRTKAQAKTVAIRPVRLVAAMGFQHPQLGAWVRGEERTLPPADAVVALVETGYLTAPDILPTTVPPARKAPAKTATPPGAGTARLAAVMAFTHPAVGAWTGGEERTLPTTPDVAALVQAGNLRVVDGPALADPAPPAEPPIPDGDVSALTATMAFTRPRLGAWQRGETRTVPVDGDVVAAIRAGYLRAVPESPAALAAAPEPAVAGTSGDVGTAKVRAVMAFTHPTHGRWAKGETRTVPVDDATIILVETGYLEPVWDDQPPTAAPASVQLQSPNGQVTVYPAIKTRGVSGVDPVWAAAAAAHAAANPGRGTPRLRKRRH